MFDGASTRNMVWQISHRAEKRARLIADRHYNRQKIGSPQFVPPGRCLVLYAKTGTGQAFWITSYPFAQYVKHAWAGAWVCSAFRNEGAGRASDLIRQAVAATRAYYGDPPDLGMITFIDRSKVKPTMVRGKETWGRTYELAGFKPVGETKKDNLLAMQLLPIDMPAPEKALSKIYTWQDRIDNYNQHSGFPSSLFIADDGRVVGTWILGQDFRNKMGYHGEYPPNYLRRIKTLFPDKPTVLHLFSGKVDVSAFPGDTVDLDAKNLGLNPTYRVNAETCEGVPLFLYSLVVADPPYSNEDADRYGTPMINRNKVMEALKRLSPGAHVVWLDTMLPMWSKKYFNLEAAIGVLRSSNHRFRMISIFRRL